MAEILEISDSAEPEQPYTEYLVDRRPRACLDGIYKDAEDLRLVRAGRVLLGASDIRRLQPGGWLNDKIIEAYLELLRTRFNSLYVFSTHFYSSVWNKPYAAVREWLQGVDLTAYEYVVFPIHSTAHWTLIIVSEYNIEYYNSLGLPDGRATCAIRDLMRAVHFEHRRAEGAYAIRNMEDHIPFQQNKDDCGVFCCMYARHRVDPDCAGFFSSGSVEVMRKRMLHELLAGEIIYSSTGE